MGQFLSSQRFPNVPALAGWLEYRAQREGWESKLRRLALYLGYDWEEVTGDRDLEYAADEKKEEPRATTLG